MKLIFIFIDGFGLGEVDERKNPIYKANTPTWDYIIKRGRLIATDACLEVAGLPQSATGQTSIFTGVNASKVLGRHLHGQPTEALRNIIKNSNLFKELLERGFTVTNANVYRPEYLSRILDPKEKEYKPSVTTVMTLESGLSCRTLEDYKLGKGLYHDITGKILAEEGYVESTISPSDAARRLYNLSREYDLTMFEHFLTDVIGHKMDMEEAVGNIELIDSFLGELIKLVDLEEDFIIITSDHGNIEDLSVKTHTFNKVPTVILGNREKIDSINIKSLIDITPAILNLFDNYGNLDKQGKGLEN
ncbi:alkaline phosphatase family protein [Acetivibrio clariflavus]|uniref:Putative phosphoglycerate mutase, AP superfamily n=1 Tax=Acetivibrio clariflavus (strain DSM 19732 / NBRC 101661 / EBR45) TaxID=720554 RepID=G8M3C0_ACECE|nr:alkaline phosphatase family protein [Acetivibrio clariflavus]AEV70440.1 putative phosphoglycerate mutase, AP superfamily [Acetivibrio clariflavus DSM 19732]